MKLTATTVPFSSVVRASVSIQDEAGAVVAIVAVMVPDPSRDYKATAGPIIDQIVKAFPACVDVPARAGGVR